MAGRGPFCRQYFLLFHAHSGASTPRQAAANDVHTNRACFANRRDRLRNTASLANRIDPNDLRPSMACIGLQAFAISSALKALRGKIQRRSEMLAEVLLVIVQLIYQSLYPNAAKPKAPTTDARKRRKKLSLGQST
jgi:hypothetical protein